MNHNISNVGQPHFFPPGKIYRKKYWEKINMTRSVETSFFYGTKSIEKKKLRKDKYWQDQLRQAFSTGQNLLKKIERER